MKFNFTVEDPITVLKFLETIVEQFHNPLMSEMEAYATLPNFLEVVAREHFLSCQCIGSSSSGGVHNWPTAVQCLLESYATNDAIHEAVSSFRDV